MLHMVVLTHGPDTCAAANEVQGKMAQEAYDQREEIAKKHQIKLEGAWVNPTAHVFYMLIEAPNAHAINNFMAESKFFLWNTINIHPITTLEEAMQLTR